MTNDILTRINNLNFKHIYIRFSNKSPGICRIYTIFYEFFLVRASNLSPRGERYISYYPTAIKFRRDLILQRKNKQASQQGCDS